MSLEISGQYLNSTDWSGFLISQFIKYLAYILKLEILKCISKHFKMPEENLINKEISLKKMYGLVSYPLARFSILFRDPSRIITKFFVVSQDCNLNCSLSFGFYSPKDGLYSLQIM